MESSPYDEEYKIDDGDETSQVDLYTPSPRGQLKKVSNNEMYSINFMFSIDLRFVKYLSSSLPFN